MVAVTISPCWRRKRTTSAAVRFSLGPNSCGDGALLDDDRALGDGSIRRRVGGHRLRRQLLHGATTAPTALAGGPPLRAAGATGPAAGTAETGATRASTRTAGAATGTAAVATTRSGSTAAHAGTATAGAARPACAGTGGTSDAAGAAGTGTRGAGTGATCTGGRRDGPARGRQRPARGRRDGLARRRERAGRAGGAPAPRGAPAARRAGDRREPAGRAPGGDETGRVPGGAGRAGGAVGLAARATGAVGAADAEVVLEVALAGDDAVLVVLAVGDLGLLGGRGRWRLVRRPPARPARAPALRAP